MRVMVLVKATKSSEAGELPSKQLFMEMGKFNEELVKAGIMRAGDGLRPSAEGVRVHFSGATRTVTDGPFAETKELLAGYWLWEVDSMEEAIEWVKRCPNPMIEDSDIEIRPFYEIADFAELDPTGELALEEAQLSKAVAAQQSASGSQVQPYLFFAGRCEEALQFYQQVIGARLGMVMRFNESPDPLPEGLLQPGFEQKIMHSEFRVGNLTVMASDGCNDSTPFSGFSLALTVPAEADADRVFDALADEGEVVMPLGPTFWSPRYGQVRDKFGVAWMVMVPGESM